MRKATTIEIVAPSGIKFEYRGDIEISIDDLDIVWIRASSMLPCTTNELTWDMKVIDAWPKEDIKEMIGR